MSIINDALKKTQTVLNPKEKNSQSKQPEEKKKRKTAKKEKSKQKINTTPLLIVGILILLISGIFFLSKTKPAKRIVKQLPIPSIIKPHLTPKKRTFKKGELVLSGTMQTGDTKVAIINGDIYSVGEKINGHTINTITLKTVLLKSSEGEDILLDVRQN